MSDVVWSVNIFLAIGLLGVAYILYYILTLDNAEETSNHSDSAETTDE
jgi:threonine/homoserine/homoserine lactone efflux protein